jgi:hypothetical protein
VASRRGLTAEKSGKRQKIGRVNPSKTDKSAREPEVPLALRRFEPSA